MEPRKQTEGEWRVGLDFNPSGNQAVTAVKQASASLIDTLLTISQDRDHVGSRDASIAITHYETAAMFAVKAITKKPRE